MNTGAVDTLLEAAVTDGVTPGGVLLVADAGEVVWRRPFGKTARVPAPGPTVDLDTLYDVASLTKPLITVALVMRLIEAGRLGLDTHAAIWVPEADPKIRVRDLLSHSAGYPAWLPFFETLHDRDAMVAAAAREPLAYPTGTKSVYSDLGFMVLGAIVERVAGARLDRLAATTLFADAGAATARFVDLATPDRPTHVAPTEVCPRRGLVVGEVHDDNCHAAGGILGHAGLFATADDVSTLARVLVASWHGLPVAGGYPPELVRTFFAPAGVPGSTWRLGWDGPAAHGSSAGELWSKAGVGHLGFTGCSLWIDPARARWVVLLTNRVHPSREDRRITTLRPAVHDAVHRMLDHLGADG
jgi:CubicO group peptidase (beta-lactamase class C family)